MKKKLVFVLGLLFVIVMKGFAEGKEIVEYSEPFLISAKRNAEKNYVSIFYGSYYNYDIGYYFIPNGKAFSDEEIRKFIKKVRLDTYEYANVLTPKYLANYMNSNLDCLGINWLSSLEFQLDNIDDSDEKYTSYVFFLEE